jgi:hypothetical protein
MYPNQRNLRLQSDLQQLAMYQRDMLAMLRLKTISDPQREDVMDSMFQMHQELTRSLERTFIAWRNAE